MPGPSTPRLPVLDVQRHLVACSDSLIRTIALLLKSIHTNGPGTLAFLHLQKPARDILNHWKARTSLSFCAEKTSMMTVVSELVPLHTYQNGSKRPLITLFGDLGAFGSITILCWCDVAWDKNQGMLSAHEKAVQSKGFLLATSRCTFRFRLTSPWIWISL